MKASIKFREEQKPLFKSKIPISILGLPFQSGVTAGNSKELCLSIATFFDSGPSFRVSYRPNDAFNPFSLTIKSGIGHFGSPSNAPMTMSAEFNFLGNNNNNNNKSSIDSINSINSGFNPRFMIHFKPNFGDFCVKKSQSSVISDFKSGKYVNDVVYEEDDGEIIDNVNVGKKMTGFPLRKAVETAVAGTEIGAKTSLPVRNGVVLGFRWGVKFPADGLKNLFNDQSGRVSISPRGVPLLVLNKIGIEHVAKADKEADKKVVAVAVAGAGANEVVTRGAELAEACFGVKKELEMIRFENVGLGKAVEELRAEIGGRKCGQGGDEISV